MDRRLLFCTLALGSAAIWCCAASWLFLLGTGLLSRYGYSPVAWFDYLPYAGNAAVNLWLWIAGIGGGAPLLGLGIAWCRRADGRPLHGAARWARRWEAQRRGIAYVRKPDGTGIILGRERSWLGTWRYLVLRGTEHVSLHAKTRAGKGVSFVVPNCLLCQGSLVVLDVKRENYEYTAGRRAAMGQDVYLFDPGSDERRTHRWNPFSIVDRASPKHFDQIHRIGNTLFPEIPNDAKPFWQDGGRAAFIAVTTIVAESPALPLTPATVLRFFARGDGGEALVKMIEDRRRTANPYSQSAVDGISDWQRGSAEQVDGLRKTVSTTLAIFFNPSVAAATEVSDFDLRDLRRRRMSIYVAVAPSNMRRMRPLLAVFFQQLVEVNTDVLPKHDKNLCVPVLCMMDEFVRVGRVPVLAEAFAYSADFGLRFALVLQNVPQLRGLYGMDGAQDILTNTGAEIVFGTNDAKDTQEVSGRLGFETVDATASSRPRFWSFFRAKAHSETVHQHRRALQLPQEVAAMPEDQQIILRANMPPIRVHKNRWYDDPTFSNLSVRAPLAPQINVPIAIDDGQTQISRKRASGYKPKQTIP